ncbi:tripartite tricarboxylate transporter TctB family protein [Pararhodobacter oceanensis]|uniref:tripartite tricarboxylate transporter TctB family protein n=1 Tax=Pararhodobacter oceanensis TaxID=2172121 RepID=UPI003A8E232A
MSARSGTPFVRPHSDFWLGLALVILGGIAAWMASGFDAMSRNYPIALSSAVIVLGALLVAKSRRPKAEIANFAIAGPVALIASLTLIAWIVALTYGLGYILPTFVMQAVFMTVCGVRGFGKVALIAAIITGVSYLAFIVGLGVRLPTTIAPWLM